MICEMMIAGLAVSPCDIAALEMSPLKPEKRCIMLMETGKRYTLPMSCLKAHEQTNVAREGNQPQFTSQAKSI